MSEHDDHDHSDHDHDHGPDHGHDHGHDHSHGRGHSHADHLRGKAPEAILRAMGVTVIFMFIEFAGGYVANSLALISDGAHMLTDVGAMGLSLFAIWVSRRPSNSKMSFGYHRAEILGALVSGLSIWLIAAGLIYEAIKRLQAPPDVQGPVVFVVATIGLAANLLSMKMLHSAKGENMNVRAAYLHMLSDSLGSAGAIIAGAILWITHWRLIDPIVTIGFAILMLVTSWSLVQEAVGILMESTPAGLDPDQVRSALQSIPGVSEAHDLHIWTVASGRLALSVHIIAEKTEDALNAANRLLEERYGIIHTTVQVEHPDRFVSSRCYDCAGPQKARKKA